MGRRRQAGRAEAGEEAGDEAWRAVFGGLEGHGGVGADSPTLATCFQESVWAAAAAQVSPLLLPLSDSLKISQLILSSCVTSCSAQAAINYLKILCFIWLFFNF